MVNTRATSKKNMDDIVSLINKKFDEFKASFMTELKGELDKLIDAEKTEINNYIDGKKTELAEVSDFAASLKSVQEHVKMLQHENKGIKKSYNVLKTELDDLKQYTRRPNLRLLGVRKERGETSGDVLKFVENMCKEVSPDMFNFGSPIDRAHRIGKAKTDSNGVTTQTIIFRFSTFRDRTIVYRARKDIKKNYNYRIFLDLVPSKLTLLSEARELIKDVEGIQFVYSDINCYTRAFLKSGEHVLFSSLSDLQLIIADP